MVGICNFTDFTFSMKALFFVLRIPRDNFNTSIFLQCFGLEIVTHRDHSHLEETPLIMPRLSQSDRNRVLALILHGVSQFVVSRRLGVDHLMI